MDGGPNTHEDFSRPMHPQVHEEFSRPMHPQEHEKFGRQMHPQAHEEFSRPMHPQDDERLREAYNPQNPLPEGFDRSSRSQDQFARHQPLFQGNFSQPYDPRLERGTAKFYGYKDSSGDQGDVDSGDDVMSRPDSGHQPALPPRLPLPLPRNRVVIGGYDHETPL